MSQKPTLSHDPPFLRRRDVASAACTGQRQWRRTDHTRWLSGTVPTMRGSPLPPCSWQMAWWVCWKIVREREKDSVSFLENDLGERVSLVELGRESETLWVWGKLIRERGCRETRWVCWKIIRERGSEFERELEEWRKFQFLGEIGKQKVYNQPISHQNPFLFGSRDW